MAGLERLFRPGAKRRMEVTLRLPTKEKPGIFSLYGTDAQILCYYFLFQSTPGFIIEPRCYNWMKLALDNLNRGGRATRHLEFSHE